MAFSNKKKKFLGAVILLLFFIAWYVFIYNIPSTEIVELIGINNGYLLTFFASLLGGTFILVPFPYHLIVFTLASGGLNPFLLGIFAGTGILIGDSTSYFIGYTGREIVTGKLQLFFKRLYDWCLDKPKWILPTFLYIYSSVIPIPNDLIIVPLGFARYPYTRIVIPLWLGAITFNTLLAFAGLYGLEWIINLI